MTQVDASLPSLELDQLFGDTLPVLPYDSFTGKNIFFHEGLQAPSQADSGSLAVSDSVPQSSESPTYVNESEAPKKGRAGKKGSAKPKDSDQLERIRAKNRRYQGTWSGVPSLSARAPGQSWRSSLRRPAAPACMHAPTFGNRAGRRAGGPCLHAREVCRHAHVWGKRGGQARGGGDIRRAT